MLTFTSITSSLFSKRWRVAGLLQEAHPVSERFGKTGTKRGIVLTTGSSFDLFEEGKVAEGPTKPPFQKKEKRGSIASIKIDPKFLRALSHEVRIQIVAELNKPGRILSPSQFAELTDRPLGNVSYHFNELAKLDAITLDHTKPVRGSTEHFYRAAKRMLFDSKEWSTLPSQFKQGVAARALSDFLNAAREAIEAGTSMLAMTRI